LDNFLLKAVLEPYIVNRPYFVKRVVATTLMLLAALSHNHSFAAQESGDVVEPSVLEKTIRRHFAGQSGYHVGDLITRSQVAELQVYLRRTRCHGPACHPFMLQRVLPDTCRIVKLFYSKNRGNVLRKAAQKLGGYAVIEALTRSPANYTQLVKAADSASVDAIVQLAETTGFGRGYETANSEGPKKRRKKVIYTAAEFLNATSVTTEAKVLIDQPQQPVP